MRSPRPIFIIGTERSGSNLLRLILDAHSQITIPHPPHLMNYFGHLDYGDLEVDQNCKSLIHDMLRLISVHIFPWDEFELTAKSIFENLIQRTHFGIVAAIYEHVLQQRNGIRWGCKSTFMIHYVDEVLEVYPDAQFILLVRDPRDVAASARKSVFSPCHPYYNALLWNRQQKHGIELINSLKNNQIHTLHYELLLQHPETVLTDLCNFLREDFEPALLQFSKREQANKSASLSESWKNTNQPIMKNNHGKFRKELSPTQIQIIESITHETMKHFGYEPLNEPSSPLQFGASTLAIYRLHELLMRSQIEFRSWRKDSNHWQRWKRDATASWCAFKKPHKK